MEHADELFGGEDIRLRKFTDEAGVLRMKERDPMRRILEQFEERFPQLFVAVYLAAFEDLKSLRQFGFWMLNRAAYEDVDLNRPNACGILILVDVNSKHAAITYGYALEPYLDEKSTFVALSAGHPMFLQSEYVGALRAVVRKLEGILIRGWQRVKKNPEAVLAEGGQKPRKVREVLESIREGNVPAKRKKAPKREDG